MSVGRRLFLRGMAMAPAVAKMMAPAVTNAALHSGAGVGPNLPYSGAEVAPSIAGDSSVEITSFAEWLKLGGEEALRREAQQVRGFDADLLSMRLPMATLVRMQRARNEKTIYEQHKKAIERRLMSGAFKWWFH